MLDAPCSAISLGFGSASHRSRSVFDWVLRLYKCWEGGFKGTYTGSGRRQPSYPDQREKTTELVPYLSGWNLHVVPDHVRFECRFASVPSLRHKRLGITYMEKVY